MNLGHELPVNNADIGNSICSKTCFKQCSVFFVLFFFNIHLQIRYWICYLSISTLYCENNIHIIKAGYIWFQLNLRICILHYTSENMNHMNNLLLFPAPQEAKKELFQSVCD